MSRFKIALVHDYLKEYGGAERVLEAIHEVWPEVPVYTAFVDYKGLGPHAERIKKWDIRTSWVQKVWPVRKLHSPLRFLTPLVWESFNFDEYDVVITSSAWYIPRGIVTRPDTLHICYLHTPPRHLYGYETGREWRKHWPVRVYGNLVNHYLRMYDYLAAQRVDCFIANSAETQRRIKKFYRRDSTVIYPPVETSATAGRLDFVLKNSARARNFKKTRPKFSAVNYYLCVSRLARAKHIDLAIQACNKLKEPLVIVGKGRESAKLKAQSEELNSETYFLGEVSDEELSEIYKNAKALIFPAKDEEFGIVPVEAMAAGVPVIAYRSGGVKETVVEGKTGVFFSELTADSLLKAVKQLSKQTIKSSNCAARARVFAKERFKKEMKQFVATCLT